MEITRQSDYYGIPRTASRVTPMSEIQTLLHGKAIGLHSAGRHDGPLQEEYVGRHRAPERTPTDAERGLPPVSLPMINRESPGGGWMPGPPSQELKDLMGIQPPRPSTSGDRGMEQLEALTSRHGFDPEQHYDLATQATQDYANKMLEQEPWTAAEQNYHSADPSTHLYENDSHSFKTYPDRDSFYRDWGVSHI